jgi:translation elongation factor P/translation initiation factor 5A
MWGERQMDLRALGPQKVVQQERRRPGEMMEVASLQQKPHQLLYFEGGRAQLMDMDSFEQREVCVPWLRVAWSWFGDVCC